MNTSLRIISCSDADFADDRDDQKSISANVIYVNGIIVGWNCKKEDTMAHSTAEAEFVAAAVGVIECYTTVGRTVQMHMLYMNTLYMKGSVPLSYFYSR